MKKYLQKNEYYSKIYDKFTIEECGVIELMKMDGETLSELKTNEAKKRVNNIFQKTYIPICIYYKKAYRAIDKEKTIKKWMEADKEKDEKLMKPQKPENTKCIECDSFLKNCISRELMFDGEVNVEKVLFTFKCDTCDKMQGIWEDSERWVCNPKCEKCGTLVDVCDDRKGSVLITTLSCKYCSNVEEITIDPNEEYKGDVINDFEKKRKKYCISEIDGERIIREAKEAEQLFGNIKKSAKKKEEMKDIRRLTVFQVQELVREIAEKSEYANVIFDKPEIKKDVIISFNVQDAKSDRKEWDSVHDLQKLLKIELENTNWRLMSDGLSYKLGSLEGQLRGVEKII